MMLDKKFGEDLLQQIEEKNIKPKPRWQFLLKNYVVWTAGGLSLFFGAISLSLIFYMFNLDSYERLVGGIWEKILIIAPIFWIICSAIFVFIIFYNFKHTKKGYRYSLGMVLPAIILASAVLGGIFYALGVGKAVDKILGNGAPFYDRIMNPHIDFWSQPKEGRLTGVITSQASDNEYILIDRDRREWKVLIDNAQQSQDAQLEVGKPARLLGKMSGSDQFEVSQILPSLPSGEGFYDRLGPPRVNQDVLQNNQPVPGGDIRVIQDASGSLNNQNSQNKMPQNN
jgi:hypothetical protein